MGYGVADSGVDFVYISVRDAYLLMKNSKAVFVDARDEPDYQASRLQTSFHMAANDIFFHKDRIDANLIHHLIDLATAGKTIVCMSDNCITGAKNRGHVSRCRHIAQYLVELGVDKRRIVRMAGGLNEWKKHRLDGILGDLRLMYNGAFLDEKEVKKHLSELPEGVSADEQPEELAAHAICAPDLVAQMLALVEPKTLSANTAVTPVSFGNMGVTSKAVGNGAGYSSGVDSAAALAAPLIMELKNGVSVRLHSLKGAPELNGKTATCGDFSESSGRWTVTFDSGDQKNVKPENLEALRPPSIVAEATSAEPLPKIEVVIGGDASGGDAGDGLEAIERCLALVARPIPLEADTPTAYRVVKGEIFRKPTKDSDKIVKLERPLSAIVRTTGQVFQGSLGGSWAELDTQAGEKKGWVYIEGPGFGPTTRKIRSEYLRA